MGIYWIIISVIYCVATCLICIKLATQKNKNTIVAGLLGFFLGIISVLYYGFTKSEDIKSKGIDTNSNTYTIVYAAVLVVVVAFLLAFVSQVLKPQQDKNVELDTKIHKLNALNIKVAKQDVEKTFEQAFVREVIDGEVRYEIYTVDGSEKYLVPVRGQGLWGPIWGFVSVNDDKSTIYGADFQHESETAGLGAIITEKSFQERFNGKKIFESDKVAISVVKKGNEGTLKPENVVDGITGATLTSNGVDAMIKDGLTKWIATQNEK